ncbi:hypothetical protein D0863_10086 [Hortaea werneckii]|uniref:Inner centromere protein ARK-binding domain-containing protein n=1 Tax=Hortaea werneckii TaxID=91943 RepID=A0A3M7DIL9_HORWE|nr:hypothetical protein D0863_10086 [Hortaea werneckii]
MTAKMPAVGSAQWVQNERDHGSQLVDQEVEEFSFSVRNEFEWLNEHMADIFSTKQMNFADAFKTPGKLRGKTPRTARKVNAVGGPSRPPLTDIFAPNTSVAPQLSAQKNNAFYDKVAQFQIREDAENDSPKAHRPTSRSKSPQRVGQPGNTDSGYHGMTEDEMEAMDAEAMAEENDTVADSQEQDQYARMHMQDDARTEKVPLKDEQARPQPVRTETGRTSEDSFSSARENVESRNEIREQQVEGAADEAEEPEAAAGEEEVEGEAEVSETPAAVHTRESAAQEEEPESGAEADAADQDMEDEEAPQSPSDASSPEKPIQRKSSFTFSSLPAREPLTAKRSFGGRNSQIEAGRHSVLAARAMTNASQTEDKAEQDAAEESRPQTKTSTQSLHEKIMMLGKTKEPRTSKSIPQNVLGSQPAVYPQLPSVDAGETVANNAAEGSGEELEDEDDDWIAPSKPLVGTQPTQPKPVAQLNQQTSTTPAGSPERPTLHQKSISTTNIPSSSRPFSSHSTHGKSHAKSQSVSDPSFANAAGVMASTTPSGTPAKKGHEGHGTLSASKSRLWSALKSAKSIFASSASASAAAKLEASHQQSPSPKKKQSAPGAKALDDEFRADEDEQGVYNMPGALWSANQLNQQPPSSPSRPISSASDAPSRKTRSSTESDKRKDKEAKAARKAEEELEKAREKERVKAAKEREAEEKKKAKEDVEARKAAEKAEAERRANEEAEQARPTSAESQGSSKENANPPQQPKQSILPPGKLRAPGRLIRPGTAQQSASTRPAPVNIRVASQSQRLGQTGGPAQTSFNKSQHENAMGPPPPPKTGLRTGSAAGGSVRASTAAPVSNARVRALEAAARKKEADERAAARKAEQKRELERKRAFRAEEERRAVEERQAAERIRVEEARLEKEKRMKETEAKRQQQVRLAEQRKAEEHKRFEEEKAKEEERKAQAARDLAESIKRERAAQPAQQHPRGDVAGGTLRQLGKQTIPQVNAAKPPKRILSHDDDEHERPATGPQRPGVQRGPPSYQQNDAKRRRTNEEDEGGVGRNSVMAPPKRPSGMRKVRLARPFGSLQREMLTFKQESNLKPFYSHAPPPAAHHAPSSSMFKSTVTAQHQLQHGGKPMHPSQTVAMSNARIPFAENANPPATSQHAMYQQHHGSENMQPGVNKFKTPVRPAQVPKSAKSSPAYPKGDNIELPDIQTDSEDEDDDSEDEATGGGFRAPSWVASPALRELLTQQQLVDPETVFGPVGELKMEEVFKGGKNPDRAKRFRDRGSSARWVETGDAVTSAEKRRDMEMREKVVRDGGWRYEPS